MRYALFPFPSIRDAGGADTSRLFSPRRSRDQELMGGTDALDTIIELRLARGHPEHGMAAARSLTAAVGEPV